MSLLNLLVPYEKGIEEKQGAVPTSAGEGYADKMLGEPKSRIHQMCDECRAVPALLGNVVCLSCHEAFEETLIEIL